MKKLAFEFLIENGANVNAKDNVLSETPLSLVLGKIDTSPYASYYHPLNNIFQLELVKVLMEHGADLNAKYIDKNEIFKIAVEKSNYSIFFFFLFEKNYLINNVH